MGPGVFGLDRGKIFRASGPLILMLWVLALCCMIDITRPSALYVDAQDGAGGTILPGGLVLIDRMCRPGSTLLFVSLLRWTSFIECIAYRRQGLLHMYESQSTR